MIENTKDYWPEKREIFVDDLMKASGRNPDFDEVRGLRKTDLNTGTEEKYHLPLHWKLFNPETTELDEYFVGVKITISNVLIVHEVLDTPYTWIPGTKEWISNDGASYNLGNVICVAKKYPITFPKTFR